MLDQALEVFGITPDYDLNIMREDQTPLQVAADIFSGLGGILLKEKPDWLVVQGDTTTTFAAAWTAFHSHIPVAHVEAGLRTRDKYHPFPEEINRRAVSVVADMHFAPTEASADNLRREGIEDRKIIVTGNTVVDALLKIVRKPIPLEQIHPRLEGVNGRIVTVTVHRRENFGAALRRICYAICELRELHRDVTFVFPVHFNPNVRKYLHAVLDGYDRFLLIEPLDYIRFVHLVKHSALVLSDSGGIQEEAPSIQTPVLVLRDSTERPEALTSGWVQLVGTDPGKIITGACHILSSQTRIVGRQTNPFGDGTASRRIVHALKNCEPAGSSQTFVPLAAQQAA
jgi:UDP-N-acetylglucosamine 2-epimerase (non-hydrolysing)